MQKAGLFMKRLILGTTDENVHSVKFFIFMEISLILKSNVSKVKKFFFLPDNQVIL